VIKAKKNILLLLKSIIGFISFLTLVLFFYAAFFYDSHYIKNKIGKDKVEEEEKILEIEKSKKIEEKIKAEEEELQKKLSEAKIIKKTKTIIKDGLYATVGNKAITKSDIVSEIKKILILNNKSFSESERENLQSMAVKALIKSNIKKIEVEKNNFLEFNNNDFINELLRLASRLDVNVDRLKEICEINNLDFSVIEDHIKTDLRWNSLIFQIYKDRLTINVDEIEEQIKLVQNKKEIEEYLVSEIIIASVEKDKIQSAIQDLKNKIEAQGFENVAINLSIADSASRGGNLGWINENLIVDNLKSVITNTPIGSISEPILLPRGVLIFKVNNKRKIKSIKSVEEIKDQLVNAEKTKILQMHSLSHYNNARKSISVRFFQ
jgi:parvulin-like peptidyl-prolyl isomerase